MTSQPLSEPDDGFTLLLANARKGESQALDQLFERFYPTVQRMVHAKLSRDLQAKRPWLLARFSTGDVVQEVFRSVLRDLGGFGGSSEGAFAGFLSVVVRNRIMDAVRYHEAARRDVRLTNLDAEDEDAEQIVGSNGEGAVAVETMKRFQEALATFPEREQILMRARFEGTETLAELTEQLGYPSLATCRRAFLAAKAKLAVQLKADR